MQQLPPASLPSYTLSQPSPRKIELTTGVEASAAEDSFITSFMWGKDGVVEPNKDQGILSGGGNGAEDMQEDGVGSRVGKLESDGGGRQAMPADLGSDEERDDTRDAESKGDSGEERRSEPGRRERGEKRKGEPNAANEPEPELEQQLEVGELENDEGRTKKFDGADYERDVAAGSLSRPAQQGKEDGGTPDASDEPEAAQQSTAGGLVSVRGRSDMRNAERERDVVAENQWRSAQHGEASGMPDASHEPEPAQQSRLGELVSDRARNDMRDAESERHVDAEGQTTPGKRGNLEKRKDKTHAADGREQHERQEGIGGVPHADAKSYRPKKHEQHGRGSKGEKYGADYKSYRPQEERQQQAGSTDEKNTGNRRKDRAPGATAPSDPPKKGFKAVVGVVAAVVYYAVWATLALVLG